MKTNPILTPAVPRLDKIGEVVYFHIFITYKIEQKEIS